MQNRKVFLTPLIFRTAFLSLFIILSLFTVSCCTSRKKSRDSIALQKQNPYHLQSDTKIPEGMILTFVTVEGDILLLEENPTSRNKITYTATGDATLLSEIKKQEGSFIFVKGTVTEEISFWSKTLVIEQWQPAP